MNIFSGTQYQLLLVLVLRNGGIAQCETVVQNHLQIENGANLNLMGLENYSFMSYYCQSFPLTSVKKMLCPYKWISLLALLNTKLLLSSSSIWNCGATPFTRQNGAYLNLMEGKTDFVGSSYCNSIPLISAQGCYVHWKNIFIGTLWYQLLLCGAKPFTHKNLGCSLISSHHELPIA